MKSIKKKISRRQFLRSVGLGLAAVGLQVACGNSPAVDDESAGAQIVKEPTTLTIMQWGHFVPAYKEWFTEYTAAWGAENGVEVIVDNIDLGASYIKASGEAALQSGHDLVWFPSSPAAFEAEVLDLSDIVQQIEDQVGPMNAIAKQSSFNVKTGKYYGVSDYWVPAPIIWRKDLWEEAEPGSAPDSWADLLRVGRHLKKMGHPLGVGISAELDTNMALRGLMFSYGASVQDANGNVVINSPQTVEAVTMAKKLLVETMTPEVLGWVSSSNNSFISSGTGSMVLNAISALRSVEKANPELARNLHLAPVPKGPEKRLSPANMIGVFTVWKFARNIDMAKKFLLELVLNYDTAFKRSELFNLPSFPGTVSDLKNIVAADSVADPAGKYNVLADAEQWSTNFGYPGSDNAATNEVMSTYVIPKMFTLAGVGDMSPTNAVKWAEGEISTIFDKWRRKGFI